MADEYGIRFLETSAKNSINVEEAFISLAKEILARLVIPQDNRTGGKDTVVPGTTEEKKGCCQ